MDNATIREFLSVAKSDIVQAKKVMGNECYRVNVYRQSYIDSSVIPKTSLISSHYLCLEPTGWTDRTLRG